MKEADLARVVVLGAGISGHTAATLLRRKLSREHEVVVISPKFDWNWVPSNIWVGVGLLPPEKVSFPLQPIYDRIGVKFYQAKARSIYPQGLEGKSKAFVEFEMTLSGQEGQVETIEYDFLINATGPKLNFAATEGLGPDKNTVSVCTASHAAHAAEKFHAAIQEMKQGRRQKFLVGSGHGLCTCQGAAFEYVFNVEHELKRHKVRDMADITFITNEYELGDFGIGGAVFRRGGYDIHSKIFAESLYAERGVRWIKRAHINKVESQRVHFETLSGEQYIEEFDFAMLLPPFKGHEIKAFDKNNNDITDILFAANGFMKVDADYSKKPYEEWSSEDWPQTYQNQDYYNIFAIGIAFAPPHFISKPRSSVNGTPITPTPPRTGMPSGVMGRTVAESITDMIKRDLQIPTKAARFSDMGVACVASVGSSIFKGSAASMTMFPIISDYKKYPNGRSTKYTFGEVGLAGHWIKKILHYMFIYKAQCKPGWFLIPE